MPPESYSPSAVQLSQKANSHTSAWSLNVFTSTCLFSLADAEVHLRTACPSVQSTRSRVTDDSCFCIDENMYTSA